MMSRTWDGVEYVVHMYGPGTVAPGKWNDSPVESSDPNAQAKGYIVEYGDMPDDNTDIPISAFKKVTILNRAFDSGPLYGTTGSSWADVSVGHWAFADFEEASIDHAYTKREQGGEQLVTQQ